MRLKDILNSRPELSDFRTMADRRVIAMYPSSLLLISQVVHTTFYHIYIVQVLAYASGRWGPVGKYQPMS
jgi:hypothetical protein